MGKFKDLDYAYQCGYVEATAQLCKGRVFVNPYTPGTAEYDQYVLGYEDARADIAYEKENG